MILYEVEWDVMYSYLSDNETYWVVVVNEDGKNILVFIDNVLGNNIEFFLILDGDIIFVSMVESEK